MVIMSLFIDEGIEEFESSSVLSKELVHFLQFINSPSIGGAGIMSSSWLDEDPWLSLIHANSVLVSRRVDRGRVEEYHCAQW
jgi:hypothetical protein